MSKLKFKACPKCHGDVFLENDIFHGWSERCLQCGHTQYLDVIVETGNAAGKQKSKQKTKSAVDVTCA